MDRGLALVLERGRDDSRQAYEKGQRGVGRGVVHIFAEEENEEEDDFLKMHREVHMSILLELFSLVQCLVSFLFHHEPVK